MSRLDPPLRPRHRLRLSRLRDIGWSIWDPIGLLGPDQKWDDEDCLPFADEYDSYLMQAAGRLRNGESALDVASYLADIEVNHMGLGGSVEAALENAKKVTAAIDADPEVWSEHRRK